MSHKFFVQSRLHDEDINVSLSDLSNVVKKPERKPITVKERTRRNKKNKEARKQRKR